VRSEDLRTLAATNRERRAVNDCVGKNDFHPERSPGDTRIRNPHGIKETGVFLREGVVRARCEGDEEDCGPPHVGHCHDAA